ncbi:MAG: amino acid adenylation domain-containing protein [Bacteroidota bacterium]
MPAEALAEEVAERQAPASKAEPPVAVLPKAVSPAPVATPIVPMTPIASEGLEGIVQQQLRLMEQQLQLLGARSASSPLVQGNGHSQDLTVPPPAADPPAKAQERDEKMPTAQTGIVSKKEGAAHGPWKPIDQKKGAEFGEKEQQYLQELITAYTQRTKGSQQLAQQQRKKLADPRSITGFHRLWKDMVYQIAVERSKGAHIWDVDGNRYVDFRMAFGISLFGHSPDFIQEAVRQQLDKGFELGVNTPLAKKVAELLAELTGMERVTLVNTGSEAISASVRAARMATGKDRIAVFEGDYHGIADEMLVRSVKRNGRSISLPVSPGIPSFLVENVLVLNYHDPGVLQQIEDHADDLAAVIIEPVQPNNPHQQHGELLHRIRELTQQKDIALLFDEMITGFRVAPRGAQQWYGVEADIVAYGKIISGGLPMAAVAGKARFMDCFDGGYWTFGDGSTPQAGVTFFGGTFVKHPLSLAASYAALSEIKARGPKLYEDLNAKTARFAERIKELFVRTKVPLQVLSTASVVAIKVTDSNPLSRLFFYYLKLKGVHLLEKAGLVSTAHTEEDLDFTLEVMEESIREMQMAGFFKIHMGEPKDHHHIVYPPYQDEATTSGGVKTAAKKKLPLTEGQQEVWVEQRLGAEAAAAYNLSSKMLLDGPLDVETLKESIQQLTDRHEALRCHFDAEETVQHILSTLECDLPILDLSGLEPKEREAEFAKACEAETAHPLDLFEGPLVRWRLLRLSSERHCLLMTAHHAIADGWALGVLFNDLARIFAARQNGQTAEWEPAEQLSEFVAEERAFQQTDSYAANQSYWAQQFADGVPLLELPTDRLRPVRKTYDAKIEKLHLSEEMISQLKEVAAKEGTTLFILLYTAFQTLLHRLSRQEEFVLGLVASGQAVAGFDQLVAHAVNLLPVRTSIHPDASFQEHLKAMRPQILDAFEHQRYSLGALVRQLKLPRDPGRQPMISVLFNMDSPTGDFQMGHLRTELSPIVRKYETFDSFINVKPLSEGACFEWIYNTDLFDSLSIQRRLAEFHCLLQSIIADPSQSVSRLNILPDTEQQLLQSWQYPRADYPRDICVHQWISQQARQHPNRIALASGQKELRYDQLEDASKRLAENLVAKGIQKGDFVGVFFDRSTDLVISLLACMKAGAIYVPLDPANPLERLQVIMEDVQANFLLTHQPMKDRLPAFGGKIIFYEQSLSALNGSTPPLPTVEAHEYAYINYTSGSSGRPKGVLIPHRAVIDHHLAIRDALELDHNTVNYGVASIAFDPSVQDFFLPLMIGGRTIVSPEAVKTDGFLLKEELERFQPSLMQATPSTWRMLLAAGWRGHGGLSILSGGEGLTRELAKQLLSCGSRVYNIYGPTETTIWSSLQLLTVEDLQARPSSGYEAIGRPISNVALYLLDEHKQQVPIGVPGELYIGGEGVAPEGYFKRADLNVEKFVENPFGGIGGPRLYRSGDMARYLSDGRLEYLQRADNQVKVRGFRIELGEVESALAQHPEVRENVVVIRNDQVGEQRLVAYVVASNGHPPTALALKEFLQQKLPGYMLPTAYVQMKEFPLTASQKVNRNALPVPDLGLLEAGREREEASTETEKWLLAQWSELLGMQALGVTDNFFELGGHSLIAIQLMARIREEKGFVLPLAVLLEHPSIRQLARLVDEYNKETSYSSLIAIKASGSKPPIYLVHGAGLHVLMYEMLSRYMDEEQPIYALQARGLDGKEEPLDAIEDIAAHYLSEILQQNPEGPYAIAGYSFGGLIAFEMARQLQKMGKEMAMLGVFDTVVRQSITGQAHNGYYQQLSNLGKKVAWNISLLARRPLDGLRYKSKSLHRRWKRWKYQLLQADAKTEEQAGVEEFGARVDQKNKLAFERYRITAYDGDLHLFRAVERRFYVDDFEYLGWHPFIEGEISIHEVPGDHLHLFNPPHGETFAKTLQQTLDRCFQQDDLLCQYDTKLKSLS